MVEITAKGLSGYDAGLIGQLKKEFAQRRCIILPNLIQKEILLKMLSRIESALFQPKDHVDNKIRNNVFANDLSIASNSVALHQINLMLNNPLLFKVIEEITGISGIKGFTGRIYRNMPSAGHHLDWHDDLGIAERLVAISINLSAENFENGIFQIRKKKSAAFLREVASGNLGDAHLFAISPNLEHRVTETTGQYPRTAAAGWFTSSPPSLFHHI